MNDNTYSSAILIVGSLFWDNSSARENWRINRLLLDKRILVFASIRYGRKSSTRGYTYTMVFSQLCYRKDYGLGNAFLIPCKYHPRSAAEIIYEAAELWKAEKDLDKDLNLEISRDWGAVGLGINPHSNIDENVILCWAQHYRNQKIKLNIEQPVSEKPIIDEDGILDLKWPKRIDDNTPVSVDFILATATKPTLFNRRYPTAQQIAQAWREDESNNIAYFENNVENGITTFQDEQIKEYLYK